MRRGQGGLQTMWAAALEPAVTHVMPHIVWCCDLASREKQGRMGGWRPEWRPSLGYYDPVNMAKWVRRTEEGTVPEPAVETARTSSATPTSRISRSPASLLT